MSRRELVTGLLGGVAMFVWTSVAHLALPLGAAGVREMPGEKAALVALSTSIGRDSGLYVFPGMGSDTMEQYQQKLAIYPSGLLVYHPPGASGMTAARLGIELATEVLEALLAVWLLQQTRAVGFLRRFGVVVALGIVASLGTNLSYWNWYGFPAAYTAAYMFTQIAGFAVVGAIAALRLKR